MIRQRLLLIATVLAGSMVFSGAAMATLISQYSGSIWSAVTPGSNINSPTQQALPTNPLVTGTNLAATFLYTGNPDFYLDGSSTNTISDFLTSGTGTLDSISYFSGASGNTVLSEGSFARASIMELTFTVSQNISGSINHDDGMSIWNSSNTTSIVDSSEPTSEIPTAFLLGPGTYNLWYVEANGAPAVLQFLDVKAVPEPGSLGIFGAGLLAFGGLMGWGARRRRKSTR